jgi:IS605 OrfB family transposase
MFFYEKEEPLKKEGKLLGIDLGYKKLITDSDGNSYGKEIYNVYQKFSKKIRGSKNYQQLKTERDKLINQYCNQLPVDKIKQLIIENLKYVKHGRKFNSQVQRWSYPKTVAKIERLCEENGVSLIKVDPSYTSQTCSRCNVILKSNRIGELYSCSCGNIMDADINAAINILRRGDYNPSFEKT